MLSIITPFDFDAWINSRPLIIIPTWCSPFILKIARSPTPDILPRHLTAHPAQTLGGYRHSHAETAVYVVNVAAAIEGIGTFGAVSVGLPQESRGIVDDILPENVVGRGFPVFHGRRDAAEDGCQQRNDQQAREYPIAQTQP